MVEMVDREKVLKSCPFCGSADIDPEFWMTGTDADHPVPRHGPGCNGCNATADSVEAWNTRAALPPLPHQGEAERLREALERIANAEPDSALRLQDIARASLATKEEGR